MKYRTNNQFNSQSTYLFRTNTHKFRTKVHLHKGRWFTNERPQYKATSLLCRKINVFELLYHLINRTNVRTYK